MTAGAQTFGHLVFHKCKESSSMNYSRIRICAAAAAVFGGVAASAHGALVITEVMSSSGTGGTSDWFEVTNTGPAAVDITGYKMDDNSFGNPSTAPVPLSGIT